MADTPLRVGINATALLSPLTGIGQYVFHLGQTLLQRPDIEPYFFYALSWNQSLRATPIPHISAIKRPIKRLIPYPYVLSRFVMQRAFTRGAKKLDFTLYHEPNYLAYNFTGPLILTVHDASWVRHPDTHPAARIDALTRYFQSSLDRASAILTDSAFVKREIMELFGVPEDIIFPISLGVSPHFSPRSQQECQSFLSQQNLNFGSYILSVGTLEPRKNVSLLIEAYAQLPESLQHQFPLVLVGMRGWLTSNLEKRMRPLVERGIIKPLGYVQDTEMPFVYSGAAAFAYPSLYEGFGLPPLEAMACGVPVISSQTSSLPEVVGDAGLLIDPHDADALTNTLRQVLEDRALAADLAGRGVQRARHFSWKKTADETVTVYRRVVG